MKPRPPLDDGGQTPIDDGASGQTIGKTDTGTPVVGMDASFVDAGVDSAVDASAKAFPDGCVPLGCGELGYECGQTVDNCGDPLNCNLEDNASPCADPLRCGGDRDLGPHKCGCKVRANACEEDGAQCGLLDECGQQVDCGSCADGTQCYNNRCSCTRNTDPCGARQCGEVNDGCGDKVKCGASQGACATGLCDGTGQCACRPAEQVCVGKTGAIVENGCPYTCGGAACVADDVAVCAGAECGTARNRCGATVNCGALAGACAAGSVCANSPNIVDSALPPRSSLYSGGYCIPEGFAKMLGNYAVRAHAFRQGGTDSISILNRGEGVSLVSVKYTRAAGTAELTDQACTATTINAPGAVGARSAAPNSRFQPAVHAQLTVTGDQWKRLDAVDPVLGTGVAAGYQPGMPSFCVGFEGMEVELPATDSRRGTFWANNRCTCPTAAGATTLPPNSFSTAISRDCRVNDDDKDGLPGFSVFTVAGGFLTSSLYNVGNSHPVWFGTVRDDRFHVGWNSEAVQPTVRSVIGCSASGPVCAAPALDCGCAEKLQTVQFLPLPDDQVLDCSVYVKTGSTPLEQVNQAKIDQQFSVPFGTCSGPGQCPAGSLCRANKCYAATAKASCTYRTQNACPAGTYCEPCPDDPATPGVDMDCLSDQSCWPTAAECPGKGPLGGLCTK